MQASMIQGGGGRWLSVRMLVVYAIAGTAAFGMSQISYAEYVELPHNFNSLKVKVCAGAPGYLGPINCKSMSMYDYLNNQIKQLRDELKDLRSEYNKMKQQKTNELNDLSFERNIWIDNGRVYWNFYYLNHQATSQQNSFLEKTISLPISQYEDTVNDYIGEYRKDIRTSDGNKITSYRFDPFVQGKFTGHLDMFEQDLTKPLSESYSKDKAILVNALLMSNQLLSYSKDIGQKARFADETLIRGGGDCEDMAILIADILMSLESTKHWKISFVLMDTDNPTHPEKANHVLLWVDTGDGTWLVEPTNNVSSRQDVMWAVQNALERWEGKGVRGWSEEITRKNI